MLFFIFYFLFFICTIQDEGCTISSPHHLITSSPHHLITSSPHHVTVSPYFTLPYRKVRPGVVCGDSSSGASNLLDATSMLLCGIIAEQAVAIDERSPIPRLFNLCPVDYVAAVSHDFF